MMLERKNVDSKYKWDLTAIYNTEEDFLEDYKKAENKIKAFPSHKDLMCKSAENFFTALRDMFDIEAIIEKLWQYSFLNFAVDTSDNSAQSRNERVRNLAALAGSETWFVSPEILRLKDGVIDGWMKELPKLSTFRRYIERTRRYKPHTLSDDSEKLMSKMEECLGSIGIIAAEEPK